MLNMIITCPLNSVCGYCVAFVLFGLSQNTLQIGQVSLFFLYKENTDFVICLIISYFFYLIL